MDAQRLCILYIVKSGYCAEYCSMYYRACINEDSARTHFIYYDTKERIVDTQKCVREYIATFCQKKIIVFPLKLLCKNRLKVIKYPLKYLSCYYCVCGSWYAKDHYIKKVLVYASNQFSLGLIAFFYFLFLNFWQILLLIFLIWYILLPTFKKLVNFKSIIFPLINKNWESNLPENKKLR